MNIMTREELTECILGSHVGFEGYRQYGDGRHYEFHIIVRDADAHKLTAHMIAARAKAEEDAKPKPKSFVCSFVSEYKREAVCVNT